jgi:hypothetical protein
VKLTIHLHQVPKSRTRGAVLPLPNTSPWRGARLKKHRDSFTFTCHFNGRTEDKSTQIKRMNSGGLSYCRVHHFDVLPHPADERDVLAVTHNMSVVRMKQGPDTALGGIHIGNGCDSGCFSRDSWRWDAVAVM